jgi:hypothetical protein
VVGTTMLEGTGVGADVVVVVAVLELDLVLFFKIEAALQAA